MKHEELIFAGFGGQGILSMGKILAYGGMAGGYNVSWLPSYGPEMRGGTANCSVIISEEPIGSPIVTSPNCLIVMNRPSMDKFEPMLLKDGLLIVDSNLVNRDAFRKDINVLKVPSQKLSEELGDKRVSNMILLGALIKHMNLISLDLIIKVLKEHGKSEFFNINKKALEKGYKYI